MESFIIATEPLSQAVADSVINNGMSVCDNNLLLDYYRLSADNRLLLVVILAQKRYGRDYAEKYVVCIPAT